jgi:uncharacterized pyridoxamine 5'-phosphate oxidase family protein/NAD-dependent dihydropyrimidine dehydrogenase PreA subunit
MTIKEIYEYFDKIGCLTFATINGEYPETRIAHFVAFDDDGLYFMTSRTKPFYKQLTLTGKVSACGMSSKTAVAKDENDMPIFEAGYTIRVGGDIKEIDLETIREKSKKDKDFEFCLKDIARYPSMTTLCLCRGSGEIFDFDFEKSSRDHKLERIRFSFGGFEIIPSGLTITDDCIACGSCMDACSFDAVEEGTPYRIIGNRCDECGNCFHVCPVGAVVSKGV